MQLSEKEPILAELLGYPVHVLTLPQAMAWALKPGRTLPLQVVTLNPEMIMQGEKQPALAAVLKSAGLILPDGAGAVWALRRAGYKQTVRVPGIEFSEAMLAHAAQDQLRVALIGAKPEILALAEERLKSRFPGLTVVYTHHGFFDEAASQEVLAACVAAAPDLVFVALGVPRQEYWIRDSLPLFEQAGQKPILVGVGGSFDVWSGQTQRAPKLFRLLNLEWLYRITTEPWRLKRIYKTLPLFALRVFGVK